MSLDTKYRPIRFVDVLGQEATIKILRQFVVSGKGYQQSYLFAGPFGSGKTTLGRLLARALLCDAPEEGEPCNQCPSCQSILVSGGSDLYTEVDAATNSGKDNIKRITDELRYATFSGKRRIYLFDEAHQLSSFALDALLKPLEENIPGTQEKRMICIFCTTEPEKMRNTILSRCAPMFVVRSLPPGVIAERLKYVCEQEGIEYEGDQLQVIAEITECHIRDALKAIEGVQMLGPLNQENVASYLHLDLNILYLDILEALGSDLQRVMDLAGSLLGRVSPTIIYQKLGGASMAAYQLSLGSKPDVFWDKDRMAILAQRKEELLGYASRFSTRPSRPSSSMLLCDLATLHHGGGGVGDARIVIQTSPLQAAPINKGSVAATTPNLDLSQTSKQDIVTQTSKVGQTSEDAGKIRGTARLTSNGVYVDDRAVKKELMPSGETSGSGIGQLPSMSKVNETLFSQLLKIRIGELTRNGD